MATLVVIFKSIISNEDDGSVALVWTTQCSQYGHKSIEQMKFFNLIDTSANVPEQWEVKLIFSSVSYIQENPT